MNHDRPCNEPILRLESFETIDWLSLMLNETFINVSSTQVYLILGWEQPDWYALPGKTAEYKPSFYR